MSRSRKKVPAGTCINCKSQKWGKQYSHRRFRRREKMAIVSNREASLPFRQIELTDPWNLGGDGKWCYWGILDEYYERCMRK